MCEEPRSHGVYLVFTMRDLMLGNAKSGLRVKPFICIIQGTLPYCMVCHLLRA